MDEPLSHSGDEVSAVFDVAVKLPEEQRLAFLDRVCANASDLRLRVEALLRAHHAASSFMEAPPAAAPEQTIAVQPLDKPGDWIGRYRLLEKIGEGGFGVVYVAEQREPVNRRVALKIIKLGMDTREVIARFEAERQALAMMDHPNIAKVFDAGALENGRPYFVMELVRGIKVTEYCDQHRLSMGERLDLFIKICHAVQHAHQKGVIHRDIKPSNILVTLHDGVAVPKVIDFGIAKATQGKLTDKTVYTQFHQFIGTPAYMSPEQAEMSGLDVDTRSDIYSLGVLLYELLTGKTPFESADLLAAGVEEMRRIIREKDPPRPSTRLNTLDQGELTTTASRRQMEVPRLIHLVRGDLDWIVMKCLEKDRTRRYGTANGLAMDLQRHLQNEPVLARPPSAAYRLQKAWRRNKTAFAMAGVIAVVLVAATAISLWQAVVARGARTEAVRRLDEAEAVSKFMTEVFQSPDPAKDGRKITVVETLDRGAKKLETELSGQPSRRASLQETLGTTYCSLGLYPAAIALQEKALQYFNAALGGQAPETLTAMHKLAISYGADGRRDEAIKLGEQVLDLRRKTLGPENPDTITAMVSLANSYHAVGRRGEALKLREQTLELQRKELGPEHPDTITALHNLAVSYFDGGRREEALKLREQVLSLRRKVLGPEHPDTIAAMHNLVASYLDAHRVEEARNTEKQVVELDRKVIGPEHPETLWAMSYLAHLCDEPSQAIQLQEQVLALRQKTLGPAHPDTIAAMIDLAIFYHQAGRHDDGNQTLQKAVAQDPKCTYCMCILAAWQLWLGREPDYEVTRLQAIRAVDEATDAGGADSVSKLFSLRPSTNSAFLAKSLTLARRAAGLWNGTGLAPWGSLCLGLAQYRGRLYADAEQNLALVANESRSEYAKARGPAKFFLAMTLFHEDRQQEAQALFAQAEAETPPIPGDLDKAQAKGAEVDHDLLIWWLADKEARATLGLTNQAEAR